jgi:NAD(P)-dependent dehydrogenase (short-subunit alcohol dehydrogenase family)
MLLIRYNLAVRIVLVVGAGGYIGQELCTRLAANHLDKIIAIDLVKMPITLKNSIGREQMTWMQGSVSDFDFLRRVSKKLKKISSLHTNGQLENISLINCAAASDPKRPEFEEIDSLYTKTGFQRDQKIIELMIKYPADEFLNHLEVNIVGTHNVITTVLPQLLEAPTANIINFASQYAFSVPDQDLFLNLDNFIYKPPGYSVSKAGLVNYTEYLGKILGRTNVRVNCVALGGVRLNQNRKFLDNYGKRSPVGRMMEITEIWGTIEYLLSPSVSYMTGACLQLNGGWTL